LVSLRLPKYGLRGRGLAREYFGRLLLDGNLADNYHNPDNDDDDNNDNNHKHNTNNVVSTMMILPTKQQFWKRGVST
jgi:hypothetical protein